MPNKSLDQLREDLIFTETLKERTFIFHTTWGLFNPKRIDPGSRLLVDCLATEATARCLD